MLPPAPPAASPPSPGRVTGQPERHVCGGLVLEALPSCLAPCVHADNVETWIRLISEQGGYNGMIVELGGVSAGVRMDASVHAHSKKPARWADR